MADVTRRGADRARGDERAQLVLIAGFALAVTFVALALLLNTAIYAENLASRQSDAGAGDAIATSDVVERGLSKTLGYVNEHNADNRTHGQLSTNFTSAVNNWTELTNRQLAVDGTTVNGSVVRTTEGTRIRQANASRNFTAGGTAVGTGNWTLVADVEDSPHFELNASRADLYNVTSTPTNEELADAAFHVYFTNSSAEWRVYVFDGAGSDTVSVLTEHPDEDFHGDESDGDPSTDACSIQADSAVLRFQDGTLENQECDELAFASEFEEPYDIEYRNATQGDASQVRGRGTYDLLVNKTDVDRSPYYRADADRSPYTLTALSGATVDYSYRTRGVLASESFEIDPETDGGR